MTARKVIARALADIRCNRGKFDGCPRQWCQCRGWSDLTLAALAGAGFAVVPVELLDAANDVQIAQSLTSLPKKLSFAEQRG